MLDLRKPDGMILMLPAVVKGQCRKFLTWLGMHCHFRQLHVLKVSCDIFRFDVYKNAWQHSLSGPGPGIRQNAVCIALRRQMIDLTNLTAGHIAKLLPGIRNSSSLRIRPSGKALTYTNFSTSACTGCRNQEEAASR